MTLVKDATRYELILDARIIALNFLGAGYREALRICKQTAPKLHMAATWPAGCGHLRPAAAFADARAAHAELATNTVQKLHESELHFGTVSFRWMGIPPQTGACGDVRAALREGGGFHWGNRFR